MSNDEPFTPPRKKPNVLWWIGSAFLLLLAFFFFQLLGPNPRIIVSRQTTYITEPLKPNGLPDYEQYVLDLYREGVTPENNAAVLLWQAIWPGELDPPQYAAVAAELGLDRIPAENNSLGLYQDEELKEQVQSWLKEMGLAGSDQSEPGMNNETEADDIFDLLISRPWISSDVPPMAEWVADSQAALDLVVEASKRPRYYSPSPSLINDKSETLIEMLLPDLQGVRQAARSLSIRAMWHLGEGRPEEAWQDATACHRLARLVTQGHTLVDQLVGIAIAGIAADDTLAILHDGDLSAEQARRIQGELNSLVDLSTMVHSIDQGERAGYLDAIVQIASANSGELASLLDWDEQLNYIGLVSIDWNIVMQVGNQWYDRMAAAFRLPTYQARKQAFSKIETELQQLDSETSEPSAWLGAAVSQRKRSELLAAVFLGLFLPALEAASDAQDRANTTLDLTRLAAALAVYRAEQGEYPETLDALVPGVLDKLPVDLYNAKPFIYRRTDDGYLLYCIGENGIDDRGSSEQYDTFEGQNISDIDESQREKVQAKIPAGADDYSIRVPRPVLTLPQLPAVPPSEAE